MTNAMDAWETGYVVEFTSVCTPATKFRALIECKSDSASSTVVSFASLERPYEKLRVALNGQVSWGMATAKFASFTIETTQEETTQEDNNLVYLKSLVNQKKPNVAGEVGWYVGVESPENVNLIGNAARGVQSLFQWRIVSTRACFTLDPMRSQLTNATVSILSDSQRHSFMQHGFLQIRQAVPMHLVNAALRRINHELGIPGRMIDGGVEGAAKLAGNVSNTDEILHLFYQSDAKAYAEALIGPGKVAMPHGAQIALRFPELGEPHDPVGTEWHTDGMRQGKLHPFSLLVGITLSDVQAPLNGNFTVFPGSHEALHAQLRADGKLQGYNDECYHSDSVWGDGTLPDLGVPLQLIATRGDLVLAHPNLAHRGGLNFGPDIRYQVYFRLKHIEHHALISRFAEDLYVDLEGLQHMKQH